MAEDVVLSDHAFIEDLFSIAVVVCGMKLEQNIQNEENGGDQVDDEVGSVGRKEIINLAETDLEWNGDRVENGNNENTGVPP